MKIDLGNVQGMVVHLYRRPVVRHLLFRLDERAAARTWVSQLIARITMADCPPDSAPDPLLQVGFTFRGLQALGVAESLGHHLDSAYRQGPDPELLGDVPLSGSDPAQWWEGQFPTEDVHCIVHLHASSQEVLEQASTKMCDLALAAGVGPPLVPRKDGTMLDGCSLGGKGKLHFGYRDGISHPDVFWDDAEEAPGRVDFRNFLLGYSTTDRGSAPQQGPAADPVADSFYGAFRWVYQDVAKFDEFLRVQGPRLFPHLEQADAEELLAAKMMGRWRDGTPLVLSPDGPDPTLASSNDFVYRDQDPHGYRCPFSAHIRVVNPRDQELTSIVATEGIPSVIRRGMPYGPPLLSKDDDGQDRGVMGIFLCSNLRRQVYTLTSWIAQNDFSPVFDDNRHVQDALLGNRAVARAKREFVVPSPDGAATVSGLPDFVRTKGTVLLLYPSRSTLGQLVS